jgi:ribosomal protein L40E
VTGTWLQVTLTSVWIDFVVTNPKGLLIKSGYLILNVTYAIGESVPRYFWGYGFADFSNPLGKEEIPITMNVEISPGYLVTQASQTSPHVRMKEVAVEELAVGLLKSAQVESPKAAATYTLTRTQTNTYVATYIATLTVSELQVFFGSTSGFLLLLVFVFVVTWMVMWGLSKRKGSALAKKEEQGRSSSTACVKCGYQLPVDAEYCSECGRKQT